MNIRPGTDTRVNHAFVSQIVLTTLLRERGWSDDLADLSSDAVGCHHGERASPIILQDLEGNSKAMGDAGWDLARRAIFAQLLTVFNPVASPIKATLSGPDYMLLAGLTSFADWIGSNQESFPFGTAADCADLASWWATRRAKAEAALDNIGWMNRTPLSPARQTFQDVFQLKPRPLQQAVARVVQEVPEPCILLVEAPMGEGKTEAAFYAHLELQRRFGHRGLYVALPTKATGNAMFERTLRFVQSQSPGRNIDLQLLHGGTLLNDSFQRLRLSSIHNFEGDGKVRAAEWFTHKKRALLSEYGVGTVDQALLPILPVRHNFVRLWGLANRVVILDEIHAYDAYTGTLLVHLLRWLLALGSSVVLLSATLPKAFRRKLAGTLGAELSPVEVPYPRLSVFRTGSVEQYSFEADPAFRRKIQIEGVAPGLATMRAALEERLVNGGFGLALVNTVQRAQDLYRLFPDGAPLMHAGERVGKVLPDGTEVFLFHARFPAIYRQRREEKVLATFSKKPERKGCKILIATQVAEQSLDLDFDLVVTDLAPIDLILQRAGRLWRHPRADRPIAEPVLVIAGLDGDAPPSFDEPLWWGSVYREDILLRTWSLLNARQNITLPDEIDDLVQMVYEEKVEVLESLKERLEAALLKAEGEAIAQKCQANQAIIGFPSDGSWNDPARYPKADEDDSGLHRSLVAQTRLGEQSALAIPLFDADGFERDLEPTFEQSKQRFILAVSLTRKDVVVRLTKLGVPKGWEKSPLLRNCYPLLLDSEGRWMEDSKIRLDDDLGLVYEPKEAL